MNRDEYLKQQPDDEFNSIAAKLRRAQDHIATLKRENAYLKIENHKLEKKYADALRKSGVYKKLLEEKKDEIISSSGESGRET